MSFRPRCAITAIGSFPHKEPNDACDLILRTLHEIPTWPQLPNVAFQESMEIQYSEKMVGVVLDKVKQRIYFETGGDPTSALEEFYVNYLSENVDFFKISPLYGHGIYLMETRLSEMDRSSIKYFKSQVIGPNTLGLTVVDENKRAIYYNEVYRDMIIKGLIMKARWLLNKFKQFEFEQICFVDEPILASFGSSTYLSVQRTDVINSLKEVVDAIHAEGAISGTHCCGNTDWTLPIDAGVGIISFDAYDHIETIGYYPDEIREFLAKGGALAWGVVPTSEKIKQETPESLLTKLEYGIENLASKGLDKKIILEQSVITPSCGTGTLSVESSEEVFRQLVEVGSLLRSKYS